MRSTSVPSVVDLFLKEIWTSQLVVKDGQAGTEYGRLTFEGDWADLAISSYDANSDGHADIIVNGVDVGTLKRSSLIYNGDGLGLLSTTVH